MGGRMCSQWMLLLVILNVIRGAVSTRMFYIHWNTSNPIFRIDNTDHIIDVNKGNTPFQYDQVNIICPVYSKDTPEEETEKYIIYNVSKEEYDTCRITNPAPRIIAVCDKPYKLMYFTITFRSFTPQPGGLEFSPGQDYYFTSTSNKDDLHRRIGGRCATNHMKVVFKICCDAESKPAHDDANNHIPKNGLSTPRGTTTTTPYTTKKTTTTTTPKPTTSTTTSSTSLSTTSFKTTSYKTTTNKYDTKISADDRHLNEVRKRKLSGNESSQVQGSISLCTIAILGVLLQIFFTNTFLN